MEIKTKNWHRKTAKQKVTAADGSEQIIEREKFPSYNIEDKEVYVIYGGEDLGYGYQDEGLYIFKGVAGTSIKECQAQVEKFNFPKWDRNLN